METSADRQQNTFKPVSAIVGLKRLTANIAGIGTPIVLFHSLLADQSSFDLIVGELVKTHQVIALNLPGFNDSEFVGNNLEVIADHIAASIKVFGLKQTPILLGNGYGGFIALLTTIRHPDIALRLVLTDCGAAFSESGRAAFREMSLAVKEKGLNAIVDVAMRRLFAPEFQQKNSALIEDRKKRFLSINPQTFRGACDSLATLDLRQYLSSVKVPALVIVGDQDEATPPPMSHELCAGLSNAKLVVLKGCAHVPQIQAPELFMATIRSFIDV
jgi:3-oxoadipate enol-lactonase